jgi:glycerol-3-phosphate dehydrogenase
MAQTLEDVLARRTRSLILDAKAALACAPRVAELMRKELNQNQAWVEHQLKEFSELVQSYLVEL